MTTTHVHVTLLPLFFLVRVATISYHRDTRPHYIRCIKPNDNAEPDEVSRVRVMEQLRYGGVLEAVRVARSGYPVRLPHKVRCVDGNHHRRMVRRLRVRQRMFGGETHRKFPSSETRTHRTFRHKHNTTTTTTNGQLCPLWSADRISWKSCLHHFFGLFRIIWDCFGMIRPRLGRKHPYTQNLGLLYNATTLALRPLH